MRTDLTKYLLRRKIQPFFSSSVVKSPFCKGPQCTAYSLKSIVSVFVGVLVLATIVSGLSGAAKAQSRSGASNNVGIFAPAWLNQPPSQLGGAQPRRPVVAQLGPSYSCRGRLTQTERSICNNADLSAKDAQMADLYRQLIDMGEAGLRADQKRWISKRNRCGISELCLLDAYRDRVAELTSRLSYQKGGGMIINNSYACEDGTRFRVRYDNRGNDSLAFFDAGNGFEARLNSAISGSGSRYTDGLIDLHTKRGAAVVTQPGQTRVCYEN